MELGKVEGLCGFCRNKELDSEYVQYGIAKFDGDKLIIIPRFVRKIRIYFTSSNLFPSHRETRNCARKASYLGKSFDFTSGGFFISLGRRYSTLFRSNTELNGTSLKVIAMGIGGWSIKRSQVKGWRGRNERYRGIQSGKSRVTTACARLKGCFRPDLWSLKSRPMFFSSSSSSSPFFFGGCHIRDASFFVTRPTKELIEGNFFSIRCIRLEEVAEYRCFFVFPQQTLPLVFEAKMKEEIHNWLISLSSILMQS